MKRVNLSWTALLVLALLLSSCKSPAPAAPEAETADINLIFTQAVRTTEAKITQSAASQPEPAVTPPAGLSATRVITMTQATPGPAAGTMPAAANPVIAPAQGTPGAASVQGDSAEFVTDVTIPDGTNFKANDAFIKTWRVRNNGSTTWTTAYRMYFTNGELMTAPAEVSFTSNVTPGQTMDISVNMIAPGKSGEYYSYFMFRNDKSKSFGIGPGANEPIYVLINVGEAGGTPGTPNVPTLTATPGKTSGDIVSSLGLNVDNSVFNGCPHTFTFNGQINLKKPATITYRFEAQGTYTIKVPEPATVNLPAGQHSLVYTLQFSAPITGTARLHVTAPEEIVSKLVGFRLTCR